MPFKVGDKVYPATEEDAAAIGKTWWGWGPVTTTTEFVVVVVVNDGEDFRGPTRGLIVSMGGSAQSYPYVWDEDRFCRILE